MESLLTKIRPVPPYDLGSSAVIFSGGDRSIRKFENGEFSFVLDTGGILARVVVRSTGSIERPEIVIAFHATENLGAYSAELDRLAKRVLNPGVELLRFYAAVEDDPVLPSFTGRLRGLRNFLTPTVFEAVVTSILGQQISLAVARKMENTLIKTFGRRLSFDRTNFYAFPRPEALAEASLESLKACGLSSRKGEYIRDLSSRIILGDLDLEQLGNGASHETVLRELLSIRGVGEWTAELTALRGLGMYSAFPADDIGLRRAIARYYCPGKKVDPITARNIAAKWGGWKGLAGFYLIIASVLGISP